MGSLTLPVRSEAAPAAAPRELRLAVYYPWLYLTSGAERTVLEIARRSRSRVTVFTNEYQPEATYPELREVDVRLLGRVSVERSLVGAGSAALRILRERVDLRDFDALLVVCEGFGDLFALVNRELPAYCLCLTPLRIVYDPVYRARYLSRCRPLKRLAVRAGGVVFHAVDRLAWRRYRRVFPISGEVRQRILQGGLAGPERLKVLHPGIDEARFAPGGTAEAIFLLAGRIMWTKNVELAIEAFRLFQARVGGAASWKLQIAGIVDRKSQGYFEMLKSRAAAVPGVEFLVHPSDREMQAAYRRCYASLFTAFNEDWGLVIIESMACGKPVVAVDRGGPREIVRSEHDGLLAPADPNAFAAAMLRLVEEGGLHDRLAANGPASAARFGWSPFVRDLDDAIAADLGSARAEAERRP